MEDDRPRERMVAQYFIARNTLNLDPKTSALGVVGSLREIGCWNPSRCVVAKPNSRDEDTLVAAVKLPANSFFEWKWVVVSPDRSAVYRWEDRENQNTVTGKMDGCFRNDWNEITRYDAGKNSSSLTNSHYTTWASCMYMNSKYYPGSKSS